MRLVRQIPHGRVATYGDVADALGDPIASQYVGRLMLNHEHTKNCDCHRIVRADGTLGNFISGDRDEKAALLLGEQLEPLDGRLELASIRWTAFQSKSPLKRLREYQYQVAANVSKESTFDHDTRFAGVDVSFVPKFSLAVATFAEVDLVRKELVYHRTTRQPVHFPYISSYLAFRELPILKQLVGEVRKERKLPGVVFVDGSGILHPRRAGIATMLGVAEHLMTIGVTKKHLVGKVDLSDLKRGVARKIYVNDRLSGFAVLPGSGTKKPLYVSPGNAIDARTALATLRRALLGRRLPKPIYWADHLSRAAAREIS